MEKNTLLWLMFSLGVILQCMDFISTKLVLRNGGKELNPIINKFGLLNCKIAVVLILIILLWLKAFFLTVAIDVVYIFIVGNNLYQLLRMKRRKTWQN